MKASYKIRQATGKDADQIRQMIREWVAEEKRLMNPSAVNNGFIEEFVDKNIKKGNMIIVENKYQEMELIGEIHSYGYHKGPHEESMKELAFISRRTPRTSEGEAELVSWLVDEIQARHQDVFRVELAAPACTKGPLARFRKMGLTLGEYSCQLSSKDGSCAVAVPLSWINTSQN